MKCFRKNKSIMFVTLLHAVDGTCFYLISAQTAVIVLLIITLSSLSHRIQPMRNRRLMRLPEDYWREGKGWLVLVPVGSYLRQEVKTASFQDNSLFLKPYSLFSKQYTGKDDTLEGKIVSIFGRLFTPPLIVNQLRNFMVSVNSMKSVVRY